MIRSCRHRIRVEAGGTSNPDHEAELAPYAAQSLIIYQGRHQQGFCLDERCSRNALVILPRVRGSRVSFRANRPEGCHWTVMLFTMRRAVAAAVAAVGGAGATDTCSIVLLLTSFSACADG